MHLAVDILGHLLAAHVSAANENERAHVDELLASAQEATGQNVRVAYVDMGFNGEAAVAVAPQHGVDLQVVSLPQAKKGFVLLPRRWVVERSFAWLARCRRLARDYRPTPLRVHRSSVVQDRPFHRRVSLLVAMGDGFGQTSVMSRKSHSARLVFLLGAGASMEAGIPNVIQFATEFADHIKSLPHIGSALQKYHKQLVRAWTACMGRHSRLHLERLYELLTQINAPEDTRILPLTLPAHFPPRSRESELLYWELTKYVQQRCLSFDASSLTYLKPLANFVEISRRFDVLTLNYDSCVETVLRQSRRLIRFTDGFTDTKHPRPASRLDFPTPPCGDVPYVQVVKLHGSVTWYRHGPGMMVQVSASSQAEVGRAFHLAQSMADSARMVYPTLNKGLSHGPFPTLFAKAQEILESAELCLALGYGFNDTHVRQLVLDALATNSRLRLVLVNPKPEPALEMLYAEAENTSVQMRIGQIDGPQNADEDWVRGKAGNALQRNWLRGRAEGWLDGTLPLHQPMLSRRTTRPPGKRKGRRWTLTHKLACGIDRMAPVEDALCVSTREGGKICRLDPDTGRLNSPLGKYVAPGAFTHDAGSGNLYVIETRYRLANGESAPPDLLDRTGLGRLWVKEPGKTSRPLTGLEISEREYDRVAARFASGKIGSGEFKANLVGVLHYPTALCLASDRRSLLITQSKRGLWRFDLASNVLSPLIHVPVCINLIGLALESPTSVLLLDGGVHPNGFGRLMRADLRTGNVDTLDSGWSQPGGLLLVPEKRLALISQSYSWPAGRVFAVSLDRRARAPTIQWCGLDRPGTIIRQNRRILAATADGIATLSLR